MASKGSVPKSSETGTVVSSTASSPDSPDPRLNSEASFAQLLREHMEHGTGHRLRANLARWKSSDLAEAVGVDQRQISNWLGGSLPKKNVDAVGTILDGTFARLMQELRIYSAPDAKPTTPLIDGAHEFASTLIAAFKREHEARDRKRQQKREGAAELPATALEMLTDAGKSTLPSGYEAIATSQTRLFTGRSYELLRIHKTLGTRPKVFGMGISNFAEPSIARPAIIRGLPGMGKTSLAREYVIRNTKSYDHVHVLNGASSVALVQSLASLAVSSGLANENSAYEPAARRFLRMVSKSKQRWLLVFDNVTEPASIGDLWPTAHVAMIITTRWADWRRVGGEVIELDQLGAAEAIQLLHSRSGRLGAGLVEDEAAHRLYQILGGVPLALEQAGALCNLEGGGLSFSQCVERISSVLDYTQPGASHSDRSVLATLGLAMEAAARMCPAAPELLTLVGYCDPDAIPSEMLLACMAERKTADKALTTLRSLSLIAYDVRPSGTNLVTVHRLVQQVARQWANDDGTEDLAITRIVGWLLAEFPKKGYEDHLTWPKCRALTPHALRIWELKGPRVAGVDVCELIDSVATYLLGRSESGSDLERAESLLREILEHRGPLEQFMPWALALTLSNLSLVLHYRGQLHEALELCERALKIRQRIKDPKIAWSVNNKAFLLKDSEQLDEALSLMKEALKMTLEADPPESGDELATAYDNVGDIQLDMGQVEDALASFTTGLKLRIDYYGTSEHSDVAYSQYHIAKAKFQLGDLHDASELCAVALATYRRVLGADHIDGAEVFEFAGDVHIEGSQAREAEHAFRDCLAVFDAALVPDHPSAARPCQKLAALLVSKGELQEAANLLQRTVEIESLAHGKHSVEAVTVTLDLAEVLLGAGRKGEALDVAVDALAVLRSYVDSADLLNRATALVDACRTKLTPRKRGAK